VYASYALERALVEGAKLRDSQVLERGGRPISTDEAQRASVASGLGSGLSTGSQSASSASGLQAGSEGQGAHSEVGHRVLRASHCMATEY